MQHTNEHKNQWQPYLQRYIDGEWRASIFRDMMLDDAKNLERQGRKLTFMDIGCGRGFDNDALLQRSIAQSSECYIGIEPDTTIDLESTFSLTHRCFFEDAAIDPESVDLAFAVMVLEHFSNPQIFWDKIHNVLKKGGVFWGFTVDARHWFVIASLLTEKLGIKEWYLDRLLGERGKERYESYSVYYRSNTPKQIKKLTSAFSSSVVLNFHRVGQMDYYLPKKLRCFGRYLDHIAVRFGFPGCIMAVRVEK